MFRISLYSTDTDLRFSIHIMLQKLFMLFFLEVSSNVIPLIVNEFKNVIQSKQMTYLINFYTLRHWHGFLFINIFYTNIHGLCVIMFEVPTAEWRISEVTRCYIH